MIVPKPFLCVVFIWNLRNMDVNKISWIEMVCVSHQGHCQSLGTLSVPQTFVCLQGRCSKVDSPTQLIFILVFYSCKLTQCPCPCLFGGGWVMMGFRQCRRQCCMSPTRWSLYTYSNVQCTRGSVACHPLDQSAGSLSGDANILYCQKILLWWKGIKIRLLLFWLKPK